jgi:hypothetical protein
MGKMDIDLAAEEAAHAFMMEDADFDDDGSEAARHLAEGRPIYFVECDTPKGLVVRQSPDGSRDLVRLDADRSIQVVGSRRADVRYHAALSRQHGEPRESPANR